MSLLRSVGDAIHVLRISGAGFHRISPIGGFRQGKGLRFDFESRNFFSEIATKQETLDRIIKQQMIYWLFSIGFATALALFAKLIWTAKFPILILMPLAMIGFAFGAIGLIKKELTPLVGNG